MENGVESMLIKNLQIIPTCEGLKALWRRELEFKMILTNWNISLKPTRFTSIKTSAKCTQEGKKIKWTTPKIGNNWLGTFENDLGVIVDHTLTKSVMWCSCEKGEYSVVH